MRRVEAEVAGCSTPHGVRRVAAAVGAACLLAACSGSDAASTTSAVPVSEPSTSVEKPDPTTSSTTTTTTTTSTTSTTVPEPVVDTVAPPVDSGPESDTTIAVEPLPDPVPVNTLFDPATPEGEVEQATLKNLIAFSECLSQLPNCDAQVATRFALVGWAEANVRLIDGWNAEGLEARDIETWTFVVEKIEFNNDGTEAIAYMCDHDRTRLVKPATETSPEEVVEATDDSNKSKFLVRRISGRWVVTASEGIETVEGIVEGYCR